MRGWRSALVMLALVAAVGALAVWLLVPRASRPSTPPQAYSSPGSVAFPLGDTAGSGFVAPASLLTNPVGQSSDAVESGRRLFLAMNCAGCHGYGATGGMGPDLTDDYWRYGGLPAQVYASILEGRPEGMPRWGLALPRQKIWQLVSYLQSLGGTYPARVGPEHRNQLNRGEHKGANEQR